MLVTSALPSGAARLAETNRFPLHVGCRLKKMQTSIMAVSKHAESFVVGCFRSSTMNDTPAEMRASMGSSDHVFFSPPVRLNLHVAQTLMWLLDVR